jgi:hypothetical protein
MPFKERPVRKWMERHLLIKICEELEGRRRWTEENLLMDDGYLNGIF